MCFALMKNRRRNSNVQLHGCKRNRHHKASIASKRRLKMVVAVDDNDDVDNDNSAEIKSYQKKNLSRAAVFYNQSQDIVHELFMSSLQIVAHQTSMLRKLFS